MNSCVIEKLDITQICCDLINLPSVSPSDMGCQKYINKILENLGFKKTDLSFQDVTNSFFQLGEKKPLFLFACHTDVVPANIKNWNTDPFTPVIKDGILYGRGASDMKGSIAAMLCATQRFVDERLKIKGSIGFLITSDEEGDANFGTKKAIEHLEKNNLIPDYAIVGEPSSNDTFGDTIKNGRRGSLTGKIKIHGREAHVAYSTTSCNSIHTAMPVLSELVNLELDSGNEYFPKSQLQIVNLTAGNGSANVIPGEIYCEFNVRFSPELDISEFKTKVKAILEKLPFNYDLTWKLSGKPFITKPGKLTNALSKAIFNATNITPSLSTSGGTSDARFIAPLGTEVVEFGPINKTIHKPNECVAIKDLELLADVYYETMCNLLVR